MTDPFQGLREPVRPVAPDPVFAAALRARIERAVLVPAEEPPVTSTLTSNATGYATLTPRLTVVDARAAIDFYVAAFGAVLRADPVVLPDGRIGHAEIAIGDSVLMLADEYPEEALLAPVRRGGPAGGVPIEVADPDATVARAVAAGARLDRPVADAPYGRNGVVSDPSGHRLMISAITQVARPGDVLYVSLWTPDVERAARFYGAVLGWTVTTGGDGRGRRVTNAPGHIGLYPTDGRPTAFLAYAVDDVDAAVAVVRAAGGSAEEPVDEYGRLADCTDDQGVRFALAQGGGPAVPSGPGGLSYAEVRSPDPVRVRAFYGSVLGVRYLPGTAPGYWHPMRGDAPTRPVAGLTAADASVVVPMFATADLDAALAAVRAAGGQAGAVQEVGHGALAVCVDDQGMEFGLTRD